jgi:hypothetical protein
MQPKIELITREQVITLLKNIHGSDLSIVSVPTQTQARILGGLMAVLGQPTNWEKALEFIQATPKILSELLVLLD